MKKALSDERESTQIQGGANEDNLVNLTKLIIERNRKLESLNLNLIKIFLEFSIEVAHLYAANIELR